MDWFKKPKYTTLKPPSQRGRIPQGLWTKCPKCLDTVVKKEWDDAFQVCPKCGYHERLSARQRIEYLIDENSFVEHDSDLEAADPLKFVDSKPYTERLEQAQEKTGIAEAAVCGVGRIQGHPISVAAMDIFFIGGSMGAVVGEKIARAMERSLELRVPCLIVCCSGGARMQEGVISLLQMAKTSALAAKMREAGLLLMTLLTDPTTGGVTASFAMLGDVILAEPDALIGFAGPRVIEQTIKQILPPGFQRSQFVADHGFVDIVCKRSELRTTIGTLMDLLLHAEGSAPAPREAEPAAEAASDRR